MSLEKSVFDALASLVDVGCDIDKAFDAEEPKESQLVIDAKIQQVAPGYPHWWAYVDFIGATDIPSDKDGAVLDGIMGAVEDFLEGLTLSQFNAVASGVVLEGIVPDAPSNINTPSGLGSNQRSRGKSIKFALRRA